MPCATTTVAFASPSGSQRWANSSVPSAAVTVVVVLSMGTVLRGWATGALPAGTRAQPATRPAGAGSIRGAPHRGGSPPRGHSHSMVPGGLLVTSRTTRLTSRTSLVMRVETLASTS